MNYALVRHTTLRLTNKWKPLIRLLRTSCDADWQQPWRKMIAQQWCHMSMVVLNYAQGGHRRNTIFLGVQVWGGCPGRGERAHSTNQVLQSWGWPWMTFYKFGFHQWEASVGRTLTNVVPTKGRLALQLEGPTDEPLEGDLVQRAVTLSSKGNVLVSRPRELTTGLPVKCRAS